MDLDDALALLGGGGSGGSGGFDFPMEEASQENVAPPVAAAAPKQAASKKKTAAPKKNSTAAASASKKNSATAASAPKSAKASASSSAVARPASAKPKAAATKPLAASAKANAADPTPSDDMSIEERYQKKTQLEHILLRPDTYVGSIEKSTATMWVHDSERMVLKNVTYVPGLYKIFDEILVNAADNKVRDAKQDTIAVDIDTAVNTISVYNNGSGIPVDMHKEEGVYVPELIFGHLLTSSNYDDSEKKTTGGRNGYGAKLANIFSTEFVVETADGS
ncbi:DNA topoisomerase 2 [Pycnococcus provasolii]